MTRVPGGGMPSAEAHAARILNIGEGGLAFLSEAEVPLGVELEATFSFILSGRQERPVTVACRTCYCQLRGDYKTYQVGCEFTGIPEADRKLIADYVASAWAARRSKA